MDHHYLHLQTCWKVFEGALVEFTDALDMLLDDHKTFAWSVCGQGRKVLAAHGFRVQNCCRVLGAHVQIARKHTNGTQTKRLDAMQAMWSRLKLSASPYELKVRAIRTAAWPRGLHAIAATTIASQHFSSLRAACYERAQCFWIRLQCNGSSEPH